MDPSYLWEDNQPIEDSELVIDSLLVEDSMLAYCGVPDDGVLEDGAVRPHTAFSQKSPPSRMT